ncbi:hypothetical protein BTO04_08735 [Polaribacter sp. SA4-10]|nr:hypothetical protein BTO04_08735 [Polaribacter sp. SA4-10]
MQTTFENNSKAFSLNITRVEETLKLKCLNFLVKHRLNILVENNKERKQRSKFNLFIFSVLQTNETIGNLKVTDS